jgi:hypothetical protein
MGGCPFIGMKYNDPNCENWKYKLEEYMKLTYLKKMSESKEEVKVEK